MRLGYVIAGAVLWILGIVVLVAVEVSVATCPSGYICTMNPIGVAIGVFLVVFGILLDVIGARAGAPTRPFVAPGFYPQTYPPSPGYPTNAGYGGPAGSPVASSYWSPPAPSPPPPSAPVAPPPPPWSSSPSPPEPATPRCVGCGAPTTFVAQYGRFFCPACQRYV